LSPNTGEILNGEGRCGLPRRDRERCNAALERRDALLENVGRWIADAGIDVAEFLQGEQVRRVLAVAKLVGCGLEDRYCDRSGRWVGSPAGVQSKRFRMGCFAGHCLESFDDGGCGSSQKLTYCKTDRVNHDQPAETSQ
jgi:hypothetical protein